MEYRPPPRQRPPAQPASAPSIATHSQRAVVSPEPVRARIPAFWRRRAIRRIAFGFTAILCVIVYGVLGFRVMGWSYADAFFQVIVIISGVGLGEVHPLDEPLERMHTIIVIALGISSVAFTLASSSSPSPRASPWPISGGNGR